MKKKEKPKNWIELVQVLRNKDVDDSVIKLSKSMLDEVKQTLTLSESNVQYGFKGFTLNVDKKIGLKRTVFAWFRFNKNSFITEIIYSGKISKLGKYVNKDPENYAVNMFTIKTKTDYTSEVTSFLGDAYDVIKHDRYELINKPVN
ncbi:MAG: hypothetical protein K9J37_13125 [Saprospiraceae bacterium]|nr:hypothetical protein [Saprospiraceae bacterium]MCF8250850.1 hypothetical protein [Saprospiraceae bacterium]MCF8280691.1 hypothetical protein [Bacteroidales bacterium]MCF8312749.1 hypothetical protein [Saprospiraceae bacterium]MCF8441196.1 hypothetical protein [Saprospiraceae bacterium]